MELLEHVVDIEKCSAIKLHILADFVTEWMESGFTVEGVVLELAWLISCDRAWGIAGAGAIAILISPSGIKLCYAA
jgi:hypothetical protein